MIILWTDALIFVLVVAFAGLSFYLRAKEHNRRPLRKIATNRVAIAALVILVFFAAIGLIDSLHFKSSSNEIISVLDYWTASIKEHSEKTYSAPFATTLYSKEIQTNVKGEIRWDYPRLQYGGAYLADPNAQHVKDIVFKTLTGLGQGLLAALLVLLAIMAVFRVRLKALWSKPASATAAAITVLIITLGYALFYLSHYYHVLGTDKVGEDVFYQALKSIRTGLVIGTLTTLVMLPLAILFGIFAGYFRGWVDDAIQYVYTVLNSIPSVLLIAASVLVVQIYIANHEQDFTSAIVRADLRLLFLCLILGVTSWTGLCRLLRAETLKLREMEYVQAAQALGVKPAVILVRHILPNVMHIVLISIVLDFSSLVLAEAVLSYINIGVDPSTYSWGNMINGARLEMAREPIVWWSLTAAFVFMFILVLAANLFADAVQAAFDPRLQDD
jgi:peptide/nickel transport system permease protein